MTREVAKARARSMAREGLSVRQIAAALGCPRSTVGDWTRGLEAIVTGVCDECGDEFVRHRQEMNGPSARTGHFEFCCAEHRFRFWSRRWYAKQRAARVA